MEAGITDARGGVDGGARRDGWEACGGRVFQVRRGGWATHDGGG